jgi:hypothetical protein
VTVMGDTHLIYKDAVDYIGRDSDGRYTFNL